MAYKAEIAVNVRGLKDVKTLETSLNKISGKIGAINKLSVGNSKAAKIEEKVAKSKEAQRVSMIQTRRVGDAVQRQTDKGLSTEKAKAAIRKAAKADAQGQLKVADAQRKIALDELKIQKAISKEIGQQAALKGKAGGPFVSTGVASSRFGSVGQPGSPRFIASRAGAIQGPADPPFAPGMFPSSPIGGSKFMFGSPAQRAFSGGPSSSILGSKTTFGSPKFFDAAAKAGGPSIPVRGSKDIFGSPAYYDAANKEALRIAKANAMPIKGFKSLPGSPAFHEEQAKRLKRLRGASTGFSAAEFGPQQPMQGPRMGPTSMGLNFDKRTGKLLRGPAGSGGGGFRNLARRFDTQSALISGGFPLLFGQGPGVAAAGALGGGIGGMFGQMGGFAGGIATTAAVQAIQSALDEISKLGQAMGAFTQDTQAMTAAMGLQGSAQEAQLRRIERTQGKTAAFNASMKMMENRIGESGVQKIKEFGETTRILGTIFSTALLRLQAFMGGMADFIAKLFAGENALKEADINQSVKDAAAGGNKEAKALLAREEAIQRTGFTQTSVRSTSRRAKPGTQNKIDELKRDKEIFAIRNKISIEADNLTQKFQGLKTTIEAEAEETKRIAELRKNGLNPALAKTIAGIEKEGRLAKDNLQVEIDKLIERKSKVGQLEEKEQTRLTTLEKIKDGIDDQVDSLTEVATATDKVNNAFKNIANSIENDIKEGIKGLIKGTSTLADLLNKVADKFLDLAIDEAFGSFGGGGIFGFLGNIFKANGGPVAGGNPYIVGEKGPELFVPKSSGTIVPNNQLGGGGSTSVVVNVDASGTSAEGDEPDAAQLGRLIGSVVQAELIKESRPGGLLSSTR